MINDAIKVVLEPYCVLSMHQIQLLFMRGVLSTFEPPSDSARAHVYVLLYVHVLLSYNSQLNSYFILPCMIYMRHSTLQGSKDATKKVGGWKPLASHIRVGKDRKTLKSGSEDDNRTRIKSGDPDDGAPSSKAKAREHLARYGNLAKKAGSKKVFALKGKKKKFKAKQPRQKKRLRTLWFYLVAAFEQ
jgi:hypothetical protein